VPIHPLVVPTEHTPSSPRCFGALFAASTFCFPGYQRHHPTTCAHPPPPVSAMSARNKRSRDEPAGGGSAGALRAQSGQGRTLTDADVQAIVAAMAPDMRTGRTLTDEDLEEKCAASAFFVDDRVQTTIVHPTAAAVNVGGALDDAVKAHEQRKPTVEQASSAMADALAPKLEKSLSSAGGRSGTYETWDTTQLRIEINRHMPTKTMRAIDAESFMEPVRIMSLDPRYGGDLWTFLVAQARATEDSNPFPRRGADRWVYLAMRTFLLRLTAQSDGVPEVFRDWVTVNAGDPSARHHCVVAHVRNGRHDGRADGSRALYKMLLYYPLHEGKEGVSFKMTHPDAEAPHHAQAAGHNFFAYEKTALTSPSGELAAGERTHVQVTRGCLVKDAVAIASAFLRVNTKLGSANDAALASSLKKIMTDTAFNWREGGHSDHVGARQSGPGCWKLLLPRLDTRVTIDKEVQKLSEEMMDLYEAAAGAALAATAAGGASDGALLGAAAASGGGGGGGGGGGRYKR